MAAPFKSGRRGIEVRLDPGEREAIADLLGQLDQLLDDGSEGDEDQDPLVGLTGMGDPDAEPPSTPEDPAVARLLPEANREDPEAAGEFRRLTETGLRSRKRAAARRAAEALSRDQPVLDEEESLALVKSLTDLRLVLGERLGLRTDEDSVRLELQLRLRIEPYEGWLGLAATYETLHWLQESLLQVLQPGDRR